MYKFYVRRMFLFRLFNKGIKLDEESWYSVCPEKLSRYIIKRFNMKGSVVDFCCGSGGNSI